MSVTGLNGTLTPIGYLDGGQGERTDAGGSHYVSGSLGVGSETKNGATTYYTRTPSGHLVSQRNASGRRCSMLSECKNTFNVILAAFFTRFSSHAQGGPLPCRV